MGYARVSTDDQNLDLQRAALTQAGCEPVFEDQVSGMALRRPGLDQALARLGRGDCLVVWRLDRLGRSLPHLIETIRLIGERGAGFRSLTESIDTTTAGGRLYFHMMGALAEFERALIIERTRAGMKAAKARGIEVGRKRALTPAQISHARQLVEQGESPVAVARSMKVGRSTLYRAPQGSPHYVLLNLRISLDVYSLGQTCILATVVRHHSLKSIGADASAEMQCDGSPLTLISLKYQRKK